MKPKTWNVDSAHSNFGFNVKHMMFSKVNGEFKNYKASIVMEDGSFEMAKLYFTAESQSITTHNEERDNHLKSQDFFHAEKNPSVQFESTKITKKEDGQYTVKGDLTMNGHTNSIELDAEYSGVMKDPWGNDRIAVVMKGAVNRDDWEMKWNQTLESGGVLVSKEVNFNIESQFI